MRKHLICICAIVIMLTLCACGAKTAAGKTDTAPAVTNPPAAATEAPTSPSRDEGIVQKLDDLSITLPTDFQAREIEGVDFAFLSSTVGVVILKEEFEIITNYLGVNPEDLTLTEYAQLCMEANELDSQVQEQNGIPYHLLPHSDDNRTEAAEG